MVEMTFQPKETDSIQVLVNDVLVGSIRRSKRHLVRSSRPDSVKIRYFVSSVGEVVIDDVTYPRFRGSDFTTLKAAKAWLTGYWENTISRSVATAPKEMTNEEYALHRLKVNLEYLGRRIAAKGRTIETADPADRKEYEAQAARVADAEYWLDKTPDHYHCNNDRVPPCTVKHREMDRGRMCPPHSVYTSFRAPCKPEDCPADPRNREMQEAILLSHQG